MAKQAQAKKVPAAKRTAKAAATPVMPEKAAGDWRQLMIQVARLHSRPLDRSKPLWEVYAPDSRSSVELGAFGQMIIVYG